MNLLVTVQVRAGDISRSVALCDLSKISVVSSSSVPREQLSSLGGVGVGGPSSAFHSTFNYPLHSTLRAGATTVRCPSPVAESPASPVLRRREPDEMECRRPRQRDLARQRDLSLIHI